MKRYFYHGIEFFLPATIDILNIVIKILNEGLKTRQEVRKFNYETCGKYEHVCLYRKGEPYEYDNRNFKQVFSALDTWIENGFVFIISPDINAVKAKHGEETSVVDEWRSIGGIDLNDIVGIGLPYSAFNEYFANGTFKEKEKNIVMELIKRIEDIANSRGLMIVDSCIPNFTDTLDETLNNEKVKQI